MSVLERLQALLGHARNLPARAHTWHWSTWVAIAFVVLGGFVRLYNVVDAHYFLGDQGRDAMVVSRIFTQWDPAFIGPVTSIGNMYLGPAYYYFMLPFLWLSYPSPVGPIYAMALLGTLTIGFLYWVAKQWLGVVPALVSTGLFAFSSVVIVHTRFSWNPNPAPIVTLGLLYAVHRAVVDKQPRWWIVAAGCASILAQLHYVALVLVAAAGLWWLFAALGVFGVLDRFVGVQQGKNNPSKGHFVQSSALALLIVLIAFTPLALFDWKHDWLNVRAFGKLFTVEQAFGGDQKRLSTREVFAQQAVRRTSFLLTELPAGTNTPISRAVSLAALAVALLSIYTTKDRSSKYGQALILSGVVTTVLALAVYRHSVFDHYVTFAYPLQFLLWGIVFRFFWQRLAPLALGSLAVGLMVFIPYNLQTLPLASAGWTIADIKATADTITQRVAKDEQYNIVLLSGTGDIDAQNYRYFLTTTDNPPVTAEKRGEIDTLFIINEEHLDEKVTDLPIYEIVVFPNKQPAEVYEVPGGPIITVLRRE